MTESNNGIPVGTQNFQAEVNPVANQGMTQEEILAAQAKLQQTSQPQQIRPQVEREAARQAKPKTTRYYKPKKQRRAFPTFLAGLLGVLLGLALGSGAMWHYLDGRNASNDIGEDTAIVVAEDSGTTTEIQTVAGGITPAESVSAKCFPSVVLITVTTNATSYFGTTEATGVGSGVIITEDGYILTNSHVVNGASSITVETDDGVYEAQIVGNDPSSDLAVIKIDASGLIPMEIGSSADLNLGEWVATIGSPFGYEKSIATGVVSSLNHSTSLTSTEGYAIYADMIQTDASINPGNSGGALVDAQGRLVGITTLISSYSGSSSNVGFAIPIDYAYRIAQQMINGETVTHPFMGVTLVTIDAAIAAYNNLPVNAGAYVNGVMEGSPAQEAGIQQGDIIVGFDGEAITTSDELIIAIRSHMEGDAVDVTYNRGGEETTVQLVLGSDALADQEE